MADDANADAEAVGHRLRQARLDRGWSLAEAAGASGGRFKPSTLAAYERGDRRITADALYALARLYATPVAGLFPPVGPPSDGEAALIEQIGHLPGPHRDLLSSLVERMLLDTRPAVSQEVKGEG